MNKQIKICLRWDESPLTGHVVSCKRLRDEGLHTFKGMVGYYMKDNGKEHFEIVNHNVSSDDANEGKMEYAKCGNVGLNISVSLFHSNILQMAYQWASFCMKNYLGVILKPCSFTYARVDNSTPI